MHKDRSRGFVITCWFKTIRIVFIMTRNPPFLVISYFYIILPPKNCPVNYNFSENNQFELINYSFLHMILC
jgi:hypothetical protein